MNILLLLEKHIDNNYLLFHKKICNTKYKIMGIKIPILKKIAKDLLKQYNYKDIINALNNDFYECVMLKGLIIAYANINYEERINLIDNYLPLIDNWAICDIFCSSLKFINKNKNNYYEHLMNILSNTFEEYYIRFVIVCLLDYYVEDNYIDSILNILLNIKSDYYYVKMAISWAYSVCFVKYFDKTKEFFNKNKDNIDKWVYNKSIQKSLESYRVNEKNKNILKKMKLL